MESLDSPSPGRPSASSDILMLLRGLGGAIVGAVLGLVAFTLLIKYVGVYAMAIPGALVGVVCSYCITRRILVLGIVCAAIAATTMIIAEWWNFPFRKNDGLGFFLQNLGQLSGLFWISLFLGSGLAFWFGQGNERTGSRGGS